MKWLGQDYLANCIGSALMRDIRLTADTIIKPIIISIIKLIINISKKDGMPGALSYLNNWYPL